MGHYGRVREALDVVHALGTTTHLKDLMSCQKPLDSVDQRTGGPFLLLYVTGEWLTWVCPSGLDEELVGRMTSDKADGAHVCGLKGPARWWAGSVLVATRQFEYDGRDGNTKRTQSC